MIYLILDHKDKEVPIDTVREFERIIKKDKNSVALYASKPIAKHISILIYRLQDKLRFINLISLWRSLSRFFIKDKSDLFAIMMGWDMHMCIPHYFFSQKQLSAYLFDAWPSTYDTIIRQVQSVKMKYLFVSSYQSSQFLKEKLPQINVHWMPEAINPDEYQALPYNEKSIDVLAIGRRYNLYHELIYKELENSGLTYLYQKETDKVIFPTRNEFIIGLAKSKISICVPSNITHPSRAGHVETMTIRYLQSMVSKCLIVGRAPKELITLFGYNPVIEIDMQEPTKQLMELLENYDDFIPLIEKNYQIAISDHTWENRWSKIFNLLQ